jgi:hypothetical protein
MSRLCPVAAAGLIKFEVRLPAAPVPLKDWEKAVSHTEELAVV